ncbi:hypothetical protein LG291_14630 [Cytobacillus firmus]|uniref:hypothetical protein n=1 Tax=Cytobacillus firmus TaxID=1399 RepID=UPI00384D1227
MINNKVIDRIGEAYAQYAGNAIEDALKIVPNTMQQSALEQIRALRNEGKHKGLIISAIYLRKFQQKTTHYVYSRWILIGGY